MVLITKYNKELKDKVIKECLESKSSLEYLVIKYNISTCEIVIRWFKR